MKSLSTKEQLCEIHVYQVLEKTIFSHEHYSLPVQYNSEREKKHVLLENIMHLRHQADQMA